MPKQKASKPQAVDASEKIDTSEGGLLVTTADQETAQETEPGGFVGPAGSPVPANLPDELPPEGPEYSDVTVSADVPRDPSQTIAAALVAIGRLYNDGAAVSAALSKHIPTVAGEPELHAFLQRMQTSIGDFLYSIKQNEELASDRLREAIEVAVS